MPFAAMGVFRGDADHYVDALVAASAARPAPIPELFGRELTPAGADWLGACSAPAAIGGLLETKGR